VPITDGFTCGQGERIPTQQFDRFFRHLADPHLRAGEIGHDRYRSSGGAPAKIVDGGFMPGEIAVGEVEAGDIHRGIQHLHQCNW
jgi:hypothetical protein